MRAGDMAADPVRTSLYMLLMCCLLSILAFHDTVWSVVETHSYWIPSLVIFWDC